MSTVERPQSLAEADTWQLLDALLYSVSHDLRSPLLSLTLSADLLRDVAGAVAEGGVGEIALGGLRDGARDMERMIESLTVLSRARRRVFDRDRAPLGLILGGHLVMSDVDGLIQQVVAVDPLPIRELMDEVCGEGPIDVRAAIEGGHVMLSAPVTAELPPFEGRPLWALASSLQSYAGGAVERLAAFQVLLDRQGA
ncbi:MAG: hypothetical protein EPO65_02510, partial [Dehalococcoidia bacterium]